MPIEDLADKYKVTHQTVIAAINRRLAQSLQLASTEADLLRQQEMERLDAVQQAAWPAAMEGHIDSLKICMTAIDRRCKLLGLDAPQQVEVISIGAIEAEMRRIDEQLRRAEAGGQWVDGQVVRSELEGGTPYDEAGEGAPQPEGAEEPEGVGVEGG